MTEQDLYQRIARLEYLVQNLYSHLGLPAPTPEAGAVLSPAVQQELIAGNTIKAIKQYRVETGVGLEEAKAAIDAFIVP